MISGYRGLPTATSGGLTLIADEFQVFYDVRSYSGKTALSVKVTECTVRSSSLSGQFLLDETVDLLTRMHCD